MQDPRTDVHGVDGARKGREYKNCIEEVSSSGNSGLDNRDYEEGMGANGLPFAIDKRVIRRNYEGCCNHGERVQDNNTQVDLPGCHLHALDV